MRGRASTTAAFVAGCRGLGVLLDEAQIADDPFGIRFGGLFFRAIERVGRLPPPLVPWVAYMQVRTRAIDDELLAFPGDQVVILGAGYDCRAHRFARELRGAAVFEVDHPATQARKRAALPDAVGRVEYVPWDFETRALDELPAELAERGLDPTRPTLTIWEGVSMYLSEPAIEATFAAVRRLGGAGSRLVFTYFERARLETPRLAVRAVRAFVATVGEPFRFGWDPAELPDWLDQRGFVLAADHTEEELAHQLLAPPYAARVPAEGRHVAVAAAHVI